VEPSKRKKHCLFTDEDDSAADRNKRKCKSCVPGIDPLGKEKKEQTVEKPLPGTR